MNIRFCDHVARKERKREREERERRGAWAGEREQGLGERECPEGSERKPQMEVHLGNYWGPFSIALKFSPARALLPALFFAGVQPDPSSTTKETRASTEDYSCNLRHPLHVSLFARKTRTSRTVETLQPAGVLDRPCLCRSFDQTGGRRARPVSAATPPCSKK